MRKFWKLGLIVGIVAFMAGCSNLWDYVPPPRVDNAPVSSDGASGGGGGGGGGKPSGGGGGSGPTRKVLTFNIKDVSGTTQEVKITVNANVDRVPLSDIEAAFNSQYPGLKPPSGVGLKWFQGVTPVTDSGTQYADNMTLTIDYDFPPGNKNYTVTLSTGNAGGKREFVTTDSDKPLSDILDKVVGLAGPDYKPANPKPGWTFGHWEKVGSLNTTIDPAADKTPQSSGTNFVAVYNVDYTIKIGTNTYIVKVPVTAPNEGATWADILKAAKADPFIIAAGYDSKLDKMLWKDSAGKVADSTKRYPANTTFTGENAISFSVGGTSVKVPDPDGDNQATWAEIKAAAIAQGVDINNPAVTGMTGKFKEWQTNGGVKADDNTLYSPTTTPSFQPVFEVTFSINGGGNNNTSSYTKTVTAAGDSSLTLKQIFDNIFSANESAIKGTITQKNPSITNPTVNDFIEGKSTATSATQGFDGWVVRTPDGTEVIVKSSEIKNQSGDAAVSKKYPSGTTIRPNWIPQLLLNKGNGTATGLGIDFTWFEGGFIDGSTKIGDFYISNTEITREQWKKIMSTNGDGTNWIQMEGDDQWRAALNRVVVKNLTNSHVVPSDADMNISMDNISWYDAIMFCNQLSRIYGRTQYYELEVTEKITNGSNVVEKGIYTGDAFFDAINKTGILYSPGNNSLWGKVVVKITDNTLNPGFRLPTSDYWRYAAHGGKDNIYPKYSGTTGETEADLAFVAWYGTNSGGRPHAVGTRGGDNPVRDMTGNVSEWCWDKYYNNTRLYIGGTYDAGGFNGGSSSYLIDAVTKPDASGIMWAMFNPGNSSATEYNEKYKAGQAGDRNTQGMRIIIPGRPGDYNF